MVESEEQNDSSSRDQPSAGHEALHEKVARLVRGAALCVNKRVRDAGTTLEDLETLGLEAEGDVQTAAAEIMAAIGAAGSGATARAATDDRAQQIKAGLANMGELGGTAHMIVRPAAPYAAHHAVYTGPTGEWRTYTIGELEHGTTEHPPHPWEAEKASLQSEIEALRGERDDQAIAMSAINRQCVAAEDRALAAEASLAEARGALERLGSEECFVLDNVIDAQRDIELVIRMGYARGAFRSSALPSVSEGVGEADLRRSQSQPGCAEKAPQLPTQSPLAGEEG